MTAIVDIALRGAPWPSPAVAVAIGWLLKAWRNSPSISWEDREVLTKTAFEALSGCRG